MDLNIESTRATVGQMVSLRLGVTDSHYPEISFHVEVLLPECPIKLGIVRSAALKIGA